MAKIKEIDTKQVSLHRDKIIDFNVNQVHKSIVNDNLLDYLRNISTTSSSSTYTFPNPMNVVFDESMTMFFKRFRYKISIAVRRKEKQAIRDLLESKFKDGISITTGSTIKHPLALLIVYSNSFHDLLSTLEETNLCLTVRSFIHVKDTIIEFYNNNEPGDFDVTKEIRKRLYHPNHRYSIYINRSIFRSRSKNPLSQAERASIADTIIGYLINDPDVYNDSAMKDYLSIINTPKKTMQKNVKAENYIPSVIHSKSLNIAAILSLIDVNLVRQAKELVLESEI